MKYTKGSWEVKNIENAGGDICIMSHNGYVAIACTRNEGLINAEANARLIAAAPDLLQACMEARVVLNITPCTCNEDRDCQRCFTLRKINQAIIKVEG